MQKIFDALHAFLGTLHSVENVISLRTDRNVNRRTLLIIIALGIGALLAYVNLVEPPDAFPIDQLVTVPTGESTTLIAEELKKQGVIRSPLTFRVLMILFGHDRGARAGDYLFKQPETIWNIARAISYGAYGLEPLRIRIPEGSTVAEMANIFQDRLLRFNRDQFLTVALPQEGYLFPDTYFFLPNTPTEVVVQTLRQNFDQHIASITPIIASSSHSLSDLIIMASILEREARTTADRKLISGVLWNRIQRNMALQVDAAFLYTLHKGTFQLTRKDLTTDSPYNTYVNKGLPKGPIGSPSLNSVLAAAQPTLSKNLFYLADSNGVTYYSATYDEHLRKKVLYVDR